MSFVNRQLYKQKPQAWGPISSVRASIFKNAEMAGIDAKSIIGLICPGFENMLTGSKITTIGATSTSNDEYIIPSASNDGLYTDLPKLDSIKNKWTFFISCSINSMDNYGSLIDIPYRLTGTWAAPYYSLAFVRYTSNTQGRCYFATSSSAIASVASDFGFLSIDGSQHFYAYTRDANDVIFFKDGGQFFSAKTLGTTANCVTQNTQLSCFNRSSNPIGEGTSGKVKIGGLFSYALDASQIAYLSDNPYFLLHRVPPVFYSVPGGGVPPTFNPLLLNAAQPTRVIQ